MFGQIPEFLAGQGIRPPLMPASQPPPPAAPATSGTTRVPNLASQPTLAYNPTGASHMPLFICRWQNGDFSAVSAASSNDAIEMLDEVGNAGVCDLFTVKNFMVHFRLNEEPDEIDDFVPIELEGFGEETVDTLCARIYPAYFKAAVTEGEN